MNRRENQIQDLPSAEVQARRKCLDCGAWMKGTRQTYHYTECGLSSVALQNVLVFECSCGARIPELPAIEQLHHFIAIDLLRKDSLLNGEEIRYLRKMAGLSQAELAEFMGVHKTRPSKWERSSDKMATTSDRLFRSVVLFGMIQQYIVVDCLDKTKLSDVSLFRQLDVRAILRNIDEKAVGAKQVSVENRYDAQTNANWVLPAHCG